jgi:hypothetical protein
VQRRQRQDTAARPPRPLKTPLRADGRVAPPWFRPAHRARSASDPRVDLSYRRTTMRRLCDPMGSGRGLSRARSRSRSRSRIRSRSQGRVPAPGPGKLSALPGRERSRPCGRSHSSNRCAAERSAGGGDGRRGCDRLNGIRVQPGCRERPARHPCPTRLPRAPCSASVSNPAAASALPGTRVQPFQPCPALTSCSRCARYRRSGSEGACANASSYAAAARARSPRRRSRSARVASSR